MLIEINDPNRFCRIVKENIEIQNKIYYATSAYGTTVGFKPAPSLHHKYLYLTPIGAFYHISNTENKEPLISPLKLDDKVIIIGVENIEIKDKAYISIT